MRGAVPEHCATDTELRVRLVVSHVHIDHAKLTVKASRVSVRQVRKIMDSVHDISVRAVSRGPYATGRLASSIYKQGPVTTGLRTFGRVGSELSYAASVERGAIPHPIWPKGARDVWRFGSRKRPQLKFVWHGRVVYTPHVPMSPGTIGRSHPGQKGKHFLLRALVQTALKYRMRVSYGVI